MVDHPEEVVELAARLRDKGLHVDVAAWTKETDARQLRLTVGVRELDDEGPLRVIDAIREAIDQTPALALDTIDIYARSTNHPIVRRLRRAIAALFPGDVIPIFDVDYGEETLSEAYVLWTRWADELAPAN